MSQKGLSQGRYSGRGKRIRFLPHTQALPTRGSGILLRNSACVLAGHVEAGVGDPGYSAQKLPSLAGRTESASRRGQVETLAVNDDQGPLDGVMSHPLPRRPDLKRAKTGSALGFGVDWRAGWRKTTLMARSLRLESKGGIYHVSNQSLADDYPASRKRIRVQPQNRCMDAQPRTQPLQEAPDNPKPQDLTPF